MALFRIQVFKRLAGTEREWTNVYLVDCEALVNAVTAGFDIKNAEEVFHHANVEFTRFRASSVAEGDEVFSTVPLDEVGLRPDDDEDLPLFNTVRVNFVAAGGGRPSVKFYRCPIEEEEQSNGIVDEGFRDDIVAALTTMITDLGDHDATLVDPDSQPLTSATAQARVQMRQLHRKRRRTAPPS
jgi:hypothetical protein